MRKWILPVIGSKGIAFEVRKADLEHLVEILDAHVRAGDLSWKTANNAWALVTKMFKDATSSKVRALRVRSDNPAFGVVGPDKGAAKSKSYLYPDELLRLISETSLPLRWRRLYAVAAYLYPRAGELEVLEIDDIDLEKRFVHIHRALDRETGAAKSTKTKASRRVPIERELLPLLEIMVAQARAAGRRHLLTMPPESDLAATFRDHLRRAGISRSDLMTSDATRKNVTFHDLRATGITWMAIRGDELPRIQARAGHARVETTIGYIREAENLEGRVGREDVFPPLPASLFPPGFVPGGDDGGGPPADDVRVAVAGSNPAGDAEHSNDLPDFGEVGRAWGAANSANARDLARLSAASAERLEAFRDLAREARRVADLYGGDEGAALALVAYELAADLDHAAEGLS